jgi:hypothetical protein
MGVRQGGVVPVRYETSGAEQAGQGRRSGAGGAVRREVTSRRWRQYPLVTASLTSN